jgi:hypothetical protein
MALSLPGFGSSGPPPTRKLTRRRVAEVAQQYLSMLVAGQ